MKTTEGVIGRLRAAWRRRNVVDPPLDAKATPADDAAIRPRGVAEADAASRTLPQTENESPAANVDIVFDDGSPRYAASHLPPRMGEALDRARDHQALRQAEGRDEFVPFFDPAFYLMTHSDVRHEGVDPVGHFIRYGAAEDRDPTADFSMRAFRARRQIDKTAMAAAFLEWSRNGRAAGEIAAGGPAFDDVAASLGVAPAEAAEWLARKRQDVRHRLHFGALGAMVAKASRIEPLIAHVWQETFRVKFPPFGTDPAMSLVAMMDALRKAADGRTADVVICVNRPRWGGGRRIEGHIAHAMAERYGADRIAVLFTEFGGDPPADRFPEGTRVVDGAACFSKLPPRDSEKLLVEFLRALGPKVVVNVNSKLLWGALGPYGYALAEKIALVGCLLCGEVSPLGLQTGYPIQHFAKSFDRLAAFFTDSRALRDDLVERFALDEQATRRIVVLEAPVDASIVPVGAANRSAQRPQIFWAGRFDMQKRPDIVFRLAAAMPDCDFRLWGDTVVGGLDRLGDPPANLRLEGRYDAFFQLPIGEADLFVYTSEWDGVPGILLEVAMAQVPIVASAAGGVPELLGSGHPGLVEPFDDVEGFRRTIATTLASDLRSSGVAKDLRARLLKERSKDRFANALQQLFATAERTRRARRGDWPQAADRPSKPASPPPTCDHDLTLILTAHDETVVSGPTMRAAEAAIRRAEASGYRLECIIALDCAGEATTAYFQQPAFDRWRRVAVGEGDLGRTRNRMIEKARGRLVACLDADDLFSENWLSAGIEAIDASGRCGRRVIAHPELNWLFDGAMSIYAKIPQDDPLFTPLHFYFSNYYDSLLIAPREAHLDWPYVHRDIPNGLSFQDWQFSIETMAAGWRHIAVPDTIIFKRRREESLVVESVRRRSLVRSLDAMAIDKVMDLPKPSRLASYKE